MPPENTDAAELPHVAMLCGFFVEWASMLGVPAWVREAITSSLEDGWLRAKVGQALSEARERGRREGEHPTPVVHVDHSPDAGNMVSEYARPTLPTVPPGVSRSLVPTRRGFPRVVDD